jgi:hypothetical protein
MDKKLLLKALLFGLIVVITLLWLLVAIALMSMPRGNMPLGLSMVAIFLFLLAATLYYDSNK